MRAPPPGHDPVRAARARLSEALAGLQRIERPAADLVATLEHVARASSALYAAEQAATTEAALVAELNTALAELTRALDLVHSRPTFVEGLDTIAAAIALALAMLYPRVRMSERRQRSLAPLRTRRSAPSPATQRLDVPRAPPLRTEPLAEQRVAGERIAIEVDVGVLSASNFYAGVTADVSEGGVFVSTDEPLRVGTAVALYFTLAGGVALQAEGTVRWTRPAGLEEPSGMGVAFTRMSEETRRAIADFCANRPPLFHD